MASKTYIQDYADGKHELVRRSKPQGRHKKHENMKMIRTNITTSREAKIIIQRKARLMGMSFSAYLELSGILYTPELLKT